MQNVTKAIICFLADRQKVSSIGCQLGDVWSQDASGVGVRGERRGNLGGLERQMQWWQSKEEIEGS